MSLKKMSNYQLHVLHGKLFDSACYAACGGDKDRAAILRAERKAVAEEIKNRG